MFYGEFEHNLDKKGRIIIPSKFREAMKENYIDRLYVTRGLDECLFLFTEDEWKSQESKFKTVPFTKQEGRKFNRIFFSGAVEIEVDKQGRILLPRYLKEYAHIDKFIMLIGVANRIEIWSREKWKEYYESSKKSFEDVAEKLME